MKIIVPYSSIITNLEKSIIWKNEIKQFKKYCKSQAFEPGWRTYCQLLAYHEVVRTAKYSPTPKHMF